MSSTASKAIIAINEESRHQLYAHRQEVLGPADAPTLMEHLPPVGWADVATKRDLDHLATVLRSDMDARFARVDVRLTEMAADLRGEISGLGAELRHEIGDTRNSLRTFFLGLVGLQLSSAGLALAVARLA